MAAELSKNQVVILFNEGADDDDGNPSRQSPPAITRASNDVAALDSDDDAQTTPPDETDAQPVTPTEEPLLRKEEVGKGFSSAVKNMEGDNGATVVVNFSNNEKVPDNEGATVRIEGDKGKETEPVQERSAFFWLVCT